MPIYRHPVASATMVLAMSLNPALAAEPLLDFTTGYDLSRPACRHARLSLVTAANGTVLRIATDGSKEAPTAEFPAPAGGWDLARFARVAADLGNVGAAPVTVTLRVQNAGSDGQAHANAATITLQPGEQKTLTLPLRRRARSDQTLKLFGMRGYPPGVAVAGQDDDPKGTVDPAAIAAIALALPADGRAHTVELSNVRADGHAAASQPSAAEFFPFIDTFGQYRHKDWPGKTHALADLAARREAEARDLAARPGPEAWNQYGGYAAGPQLKATGLFRVEKYAGKWWLVDPDGRLFFSHGVDCVGFGSATPVDDRATWFADFPGDLPEFQPFFSVQKHVVRDYYEGRAPRCFSFYQANLLRKYGPDFATVTGRLAHRRLRSWGLNTVANWSDPAIYGLRQTPYTATLNTKARPIAASSGYWGRFRDPFDPAMATHLAAALEAERGRSIGDPWCIGYFVDNEFSWGDELSLAQATLSSPADQPAKQACVAALKAQYGEIAALNAAWGTTHADWDALLQSTTPPDPKRARADLANLYTLLAEQYFKVCKTAIEKAAPGQLYLGCRFAWVNDRAVRAAEKYADVVSFNIYSRGVEKFRYGGERDVPLIIGEFHFGATDRGPFHPGLVPVANQEERAAAYRRYVRSVLDHPQFVGCHWFQYNDQPTTGRGLDGENYQIGLVDIVDTPYEDTLAATRSIGAEMYARRLGTPASAPAAK